MRSPVTPAKAGVRFGPESGLRPDDNSNRIREYLGDGVAARRR